ncbi:MAG: PilZ domain-containing protein [Candidatus Omnitrophica bacterium]|nr:PilZ domain-containing protein [Candidatus Omnitrophota bacterium]
MGTIEHRKLFRVQTSIKISYESVRNPEIKGEAYTADISSIGAQIIGKDLLEVGTELSVKFGISEEKNPIFALAKVVWQKKCEYSPENQKTYYSTGLMLLDMSPDDAILTSDYIFDVAKQQQLKCEKQIIDQLELG